MVLLEKDCSPETLYREIRQLLMDSSRREHMSRCLKSMVQMDSAEQICDIVEALIQA